MKDRTKDRSAFTLVELVVVILILGILAAVAAPKMLNTSATATDNSLKQTLSVVRNAIELFAAENGGTLPGQSSDLDTDLATYIRGDFPVCPIGAQNNTIAYTTGQNITGDATPTAGWKYSTDYGEFIANSTANTASDSSISYDQL